MERQEKIRKQIKEHFYKNYYGKILTPELKSQMITDFEKFFDEKITPEHLETTLNDLEFLQNGSLFSIAIETKQRKIEEVKK